MQISGMQIMRGLHPLSVSAFATRQQIYVCRAQVKIQITFGRGIEVCAFSPAALAVYDNDAPLIFPMTSERLSQQQFDKCRAKQAAPNEAFSRDN
jgi:hypothetical protein